MEKKKLESFKKRLETRQQELRRMVSRTEQDGRTIDEDSAQDIADRAASSYTKEFLFHQSNNDRQLLQMVENALSRIRKAASGNVSRAAKRSTPNGWKLCPGPVIASSARRNWNRGCWKRRRNSLARTLSRFSLTVHYPRAQGFDAPDFRLLDSKVVNPTLTDSEGKFVRAETRHKLKQDRFSRATIDTAERTAHWSVEHKNKLLIAADCAAGSGCGGGVVVLPGPAGSEGERRDGPAVRTLDTPVRPPNMPAQADAPSFASSTERATAAHKQFQGIVDQYPHTHSAEFARYFLGLTAADLGDKTSAERELQKVISSSDGDLAGWPRWPWRPCIATRAATNKRLISTNSWRRNLPPRWEKPQLKWKWPPLISRTISLSKRNGSTSNPEGKPHQRSRADGVRETAGVEVGARRQLSA